ncbi:MAG: Asp-tRNA(Asn)/Glu-tRNA(Gln) amidotransferase subunit GatC [Candidatus Verstraetearchaeota archaeon]|jgi:aspartyl-tRNA(Asn)/glutamyl-tRNA(Gln) amidotransferase subunit C|uniref:Aspartyl/glutamyl-tRNA(Asn/Gln) amidotransferase subunit C n=1 Tax=Thermoproteota archaeon TaxID=2056631 RepID=A0A523BFJ4_9CREN|nr:Asp-tRNA(Asn)/Glu-tRNA(Gln) amidotransferase subunit GatC [Candidatus Verstraetearchaeota archaeon]TDA39674.1 MAG: Asp-tRNA(Asn)/Glu-tRNA(Gln) amidotransferase GatCAB subunit C [Candidatus Verstraetearchaeota archaeon]
MESLKIVSKERTERLAFLSKIELEEKEKEEITHQLNRILEAFKTLDELDLGEVEPTFHVVEMVNVLREDQVKSSLSQKEALSSASKTKDGFFVAPKIV